MTYLLSVFTTNKKASKGYLEALNDNKFIINNVTENIIEIVTSFLLCLFVY